MATYRNSRIERAQAIIGYEFRQQDWLWEALQVAGSGIYCIGDRPIREGNKRLAVHGDAAIQQILSKSWVLTEADRGYWNTLRLNKLGNRVLAKIGEQSGLSEAISMHPMNPCSMSENILSALVEAVCGAVEIDGGLEALEAVMRKLGIVDGSLEYFVKGPGHSPV